MALPPRIVRRYQEGIEKVLALDYESFWAFISALEDVPLALVPSKLAPQLASRIGSISQDDLEEIIPAVLSLCTLRDEFGFSTSEVAEDASLAVEDVSDEDRERLKDRFAQLLESEPLNVLAKSGSLLTNQQRWMQKVQILTDLRPVFETGPKTSLRAGVIVHTLKVSYFENGDAREFFVAMDANDLRDISKQIKRADSKAEVLRSVLDAAEVPYVDDESKAGEGEDDTV